ncbi:MAG: glycerate kinase [Limibaculum sp.]
MSDPIETLREMFDAAVAAADPMAVLSGFLPDPPKGRTIVVGAGKASARMAEALEAAWPVSDSAPLSGLVITRYGHSCPCRHIEIVEAAHPVPDAAGAAAAARVLEMMRGLSAGDLVIALISGGGSALMTLPAGRITLAEKQAINQGLLASGAAIGQMNVVRKHLSAIKGGRLAAAAHPARVVGLLISDVPGDDPGVIASGPTVGESSTPDTAKALLKHYQITTKPSIDFHLSSDAGCPAPDDPRLASVENHIIAAPQISLEAAAEVARAAGYTPLILGDSLEGEARDVGIVHAGIARQVLTHGQPVERPCAILSGGETTVTLRGTGRGGRNVEFLLSLAIALDGLPVHAIACDTDGIDGIEDIAGAVCGPDTLTRARAAGLNPVAELDNNNGHGFFEALGDQVITGPTLTNVNDFRVMLIR